jgi:plastocyanin
VYQHRQSSYTLYASMGELMRRAPALALAALLPVAALVGGTADAASPSPTLSNTSVAAGAGPAAAPAAQPATQPAKKKVIKGVVGPGFTIEVNKSQVKAGKYKFVVKDKGTIHNFHIFGPGVDEATSIPGTGKTVWKLTLVAGDYTIQCDPHSDMMHTTLKVV